MNTKSSEAPKPPPSILELCDVTFRDPANNGMRLDQVRLRLSGGNLVQWLVHPATQLRSVVSMMQGLAPVDAGRVLFRSNDWQNTHLNTQFQLRSQIGRVFDGAAWIQNLNILENLTLAGRQHGYRLTELQSRILQWRERFEVPDPGRDRPAFLDPAKLQIFQWIRAFLLMPSLILLERPLQYVNEQQGGAFAEALRDQLAQGCSILWITSHPDELTQLSLSPSQLIDLRKGYIASKVGVQNE